MPINSDKNKFLKEINEIRSRVHTYQKDWPPEEFYQYESNITHEQLEGLRQIVEKNSKEKEIDQFIRNNPVVLTASLAFASTGHHGSWILSQKMIRPMLGEGRPGLIPDFIIGGRSSDGFSWWVVELKGANANLFSRKGENLYFSKELNRGLCQLLSYIDYCSEAQSSLRDQFRLTDFREPKGMILIGREKELGDDEQRQKLKSVWNRTTRNSLEIRTYDALL